MPTRYPLQDDPREPPYSLTDPAAFFARIRASLFNGSLTQSQTDGITGKLTVMGEARWPISYAAYGLATSYWETNKRMEPVAEAYYLGEPRATAFRKTLRYYPWYGRGDVQTTWETNYRRADDELGLGGTLLADPDRMLETDISARTMVRGMQEGWFSSRKLADYLPDPRGTLEQFRAARPIINVHDHDADIAGVAMHWQDALVSGDWS